ncbi:cytochrome P450 4C1-like [Trichogramma pretiosum]|uniref:cytochrome P450 4C1-like n=1 Tax=Trichogramma pretiosum TaxID=7493 RepID=UPI0006C95F8F|nr:cytochrome P450 4C1-like [Trichogramma pretiosum]
MVLLFVLFVLGALYYFYYFGFFNRTRSALINRIPGPKGLPVIGNLLLGLTPADKIWDVLNNETIKYWPTAKLKLGSYALVGISDVDDVETVLSSQKHIEKGSSYEKLHGWLETGLLTATGDKWRQRRRILTPAFHFNILKKYNEITNENSEKFVQALKQEGDETIQTLSPLCSKYTLNIICESAMGVSLEDVKDEGALKYKKAVHTMGNIVVYRILRPYITDRVMKCMWWLQSLQDRTLATLHQFSNKVLRERKEYHKNTQYKFLKTLNEDVDVDRDEVYSGKKKRLAMLDLLLSAQMDNLIDDRGIQEEVDTFMFEGHDTTGMAMTYAILLLAENEDAQERAREEVTAVLDKSNGNLGAAELQELTYLERCIKESMRLFPPVSIMSRYLREDLQLKEYLIPAETEVFFQLYRIHRDPNLWPEPSKFDPDRFLPELISTRHPYSYIPFSAGPRNCIGQKFALMELKSLIGRLLYNFKLEPIDRTADLKLGLDIILRPMHPVRTKFIRIR